MELNFDKEIDAILRKARESEAESSTNAQTHMDADEIAAFAENALPERAKTRSTAHFAECDRCRKILSGLILLNAETESEIVHAEESKIVAATIPWYRKLFVFPRLAYSLGALALVFGGLIAFTVLQSVNQSGEFSQMSEKPMQSKSAPAQANTNTAASNSTMNSASTNSDSGYFSSNESVPHSPAISDTNTAAPQPVVPPAGNTLPKDAPARDEDVSLAKTEATPQLDSAELQEQQQERNKQRAEVKSDKEDDNRMLKAQRQATVPSTSGAIVTQPQQKSADKKAAPKTGETTTVGGKTFRREGSAWVDAAYQSGSNMQLPPLTRVSRGTNEYKKLDADLRRIADNLGGIVIVLWKSKAYRIQ